MYLIKNTDYLLENDTLVPIIFVLNEDILKL